MPRSIAQFGDLQTKVLPLRCGGTLVFDRNGNVLHYVAVRVTQERRIGLVDYAEYAAWRASLVETRVIPTTTSASKSAYGLGRGIALGANLKASCQHYHRQGNS